MALHRSNKRIVAKQDNDEEANNKDKMKRFRSLLGPTIGRRRLRSCRSACRLTNLLSLALFVAVLVHRIGSYRANTRELFQLPINYIERYCPPPEYETLAAAATTNTSTQQQQQQQQQPKICMTTLTDAAKADTVQRLLRWRNFNNLLQLTWSNKESYCQKHGYQLFDESDVLDVSRPPSWSKIRAVRRLLTEEDCEWVFWMDADTVIMNSEKRIEDILPTPDSGIDLLVTEQKGVSWNAGAWMIRNTPWSLEFLDHWWEMKSYVKPKGLSESGDNAALKAYLSSMDPEYFRQHIAVPPRCLFNSVAKFITRQEYAALIPVLKEQDWYLGYERYHKGDFVAHVAGVDNKITTSQMLLKDAV